MFAVQLGDGLAHKVRGEMTLCNRTIVGGDKVTKKEWHTLMNQYSILYPDMDSLAGVPICLACAPRDYARWAKL